MYLLFLIIALLSLASTLRGADQPFKQIDFQANDALHRSLTRSRAMHGFTNVNGVISQHITEANSAAPIVLDRSFGPVREINTVVEIVKPTLVKSSADLNPLNSSPAVSIADVVSQSSSNPTNAEPAPVNLGSVVVQDRPTFQSLRVHPYVNLSGVRFVTGAPTNSAQSK